MCVAKECRRTKFTSNDHGVITSIAKKDLAKGLKKLDLNQSHSQIEGTLGIFWHIENDPLGSRITLNDRPLTRRRILTTISSIFDPLGFTGPLSLSGKKILQQTSIDKQAWDDPLPTELQLLWEKWRTDLDFKIDSGLEPESIDDFKTGQLYQSRMLVVLSTGLQVSLFARHSK